MLAEWLESMNLTAADLTNYIVYAAIAVVTLIGVMKCLLPLYGSTHAMRRAIRHLQDDAGNTDGGRPVWQDPRFVGKRLKGCWQRFLQNAVQLDHRGLPCNVEDYINDDTVAHGPGNAQLAELIPSLLTSLGILGTFMGMTQGLSGLDVSSTETMMKGISNLINGMQFAFGTSVAGVSCSLIFNMLCRIAQGSCYRAIDDFTESFTQLAMQRPLDNDVQLICQNQDRNHLLNTVTDQISSQLSSSIEMAIGRAMQPVAQSMDSFLIGATRGQVEGVQRIVNQFIDRMNISLNGQFLALGKTLSDVNQHQQLTMDRLNDSMAVAGSIVQEATRLQGISRDVLAQYEKYLSELTTARQRDEHFETDSARLLAAMQQSCEKQQALLATMQKSEKDLQEALARYAAAERDGVSGMKDSTAELRAAGDTLSDKCSDFVQQAATGLTDALSGFEKSMRDLLEALTARIDSLEKPGDSAAVTAELAGLQKAVTRLQESLEVPSAQPEDKE